MRRLIDASTHSDLEGEGTRPRLETMAEMRRGIVMAGDGSFLGAGALYVRILYGLDCMANGVTRMATWCSVYRRCLIGLEAVKWRTLAIATSDSKGHIRRDLIIM